MAKEKRLMDGTYTLMVKPNGSIFKLPLNVSPETYLRKGFTFATEDTLRPKQQEQREQVSPATARSTVPRGQAVPRLRDGAWRGERCFVVGGGPSLKGFDWDRLRGERVIAVNRAFENLPFADVSVSLDSRWLECTVNGLCGKTPEEGAAVAQKYNDFQGVKLHLNVDDRKRPPGVVEVPRWSNPNGFSPSIKLGLGHGDNSGFTAVNLALCLGAAEIYLLGFDMQPGDGKPQNYHSGYRNGVVGKGPGDNSSAYRRFCSNFMTASRNLKKDFPGQRIIQTNHDSNLRCFPMGHVPRKSCWKRVVSFYTPDYKQYADKLKTSLDRWAIPHDIQERKHAGTWASNTRLKARYVAEMRRKYPKEWIVWIDADGVIEQRPSLFAELDFHPDFAATHVTFVRHELMTGTMVFGPRSATDRLVDEWLRRCNVRTKFDRPDGPILEEILQTWNGHFYELPGDYCRIYDNPAQTREGCGRTIVHYQASRKHK